MLLQMDHDDHVQYLLDQQPPPRPVRRKFKWRSLFPFLFFLICLLLSIAVTPAMAVSSQDFFAWDTWAPVQGASLAGPAWYPTLLIPDPLAPQARITPHTVTDVREGSTLASVAHCAPVGIDGFDIHADCVAAWQVNTGVMGFLPEGQPITPAEARYTVNPVTLMPMGDHPNATAGS